MAYCQDHTHTNTHTLAHAHSLSAFYNTSLCSMYSVLICLYYLRTTHFSSTHLFNSAFLQWISCVYVCVCVCVCVCMCVCVLMSGHALLSMPWWARTVKILGMALDFWEWQSYVSDEGMHRVASTLLSVCVCLCVCGGLSNMSVLVRPVLHSDLAQYFSLEMYSVL